MKKESFLNNATLENKNLLSEIYNKATLASKTGKEIFTNCFCTPNLCNSAIKLGEHLGVDATCYGVFEEGERKIIGFNVYHIYDFPLILCKISYNDKFNKLYHKDFLGALTSLGIKREKMGDLIIDDINCYVPIYEDLYNYIKMNLTHIGKTPCKIEKVEIGCEQIPQYNFKDVKVTVSSNRLDTIVGALGNMSRNKALELINKGKVLINYDEVYKKDKEIKDDSVIIIRGHGKFKKVKCVGCSLKGKYRIVFKKFI